MHHTTNMANSNQSVHVYCFYSGFNTICIRKNTSIGQSTFYQFDSDWFSVYYAIEIFFVRNDLSNQAKNIKTKALAMVGLKIKTAKVT